MKKVVMIIAHQGFRDEELLEPKEVLENNGVIVKIASSSLGEAKGKLGARVMPDMLVKDINSEDFNAVIFVGGPGGVQYWDDPVAHKILQKAYKENRIVAGICSASVTLARAGILKGKRATVFSGDAEEIKACGAEYTGSPVERDGNIITGAGPFAARDFGEEIVKALKENSLPNEQIGR
ncbi:MAG: DJ-1/PfpI family protein [Candidatus Omnitrophica bacterium]|nr:DJ-1/PfpI family protein [Candidatus Omnitrophota bacterium]